MERVSQVIPDAITAILRKAPLCDEKIAFAWRMAVGPALDKVTTLAYRDGVPISVMEGDYVRPLQDLDESAALQVASTLAGRRVAAGSGFVGR